MAKAELVREQVVGGEVRGGGGQITRLGDHCRGFVFHFNGNRK